jgi:hypothetical protein
MAATAVYVDIVRVGLDSQAMDAHTEQNINATGSAFQLKGGTYRMAVIGSTFGTVTLQKLGPDGSTYLTAATAVAANGIATLTLERGTYKVALA